MIDVTTAGVTGNGSTDDTAALQAVIAANPSDRFYLPAGTYKVTAPIALGPRQVIEGDSADATRIIQWNAAAGGIAFAGGYLNGGGVRRLMIGCNLAVWGQTFSSGIGLDLYQGGSALVEDVIVQGYQTGVQERECYSTSLRTVQVQFAKTGFLVPASAASPNFIGTYDDCMAQAPGVASGSIAFSIKVSGGHSFKDCNGMGYERGWVINPDSGQSATYIQFIGCWADGNTGDGWTLDASAGWMGANEFTSCWAGWNGGDGVVVKGANLDGVNWTGGRVRENGKHGFHLMAGAKNVSIANAHIAQNSRSADNTYDGVRADAGVSEWSLIGSRIGNFSSSNTQRQAYGVNLSGSTANVRIQGNDLRTYGPGKAGIKNTATGSGISIVNNI